MAEHKVKDEWRERRDLTLAVKERVEHQLRVLNIEIVPDAGPDASQQRRLEDLQFELNLLRDAYEEAARRHREHALASRTEEEEDNG